MMVRILFACFLVLALSNAAWAASSEEMQAEILQLKCITDGENSGSGEEVDLEAEVAQLKNIVDQLLSRVNTLEAKTAAHQNDTQGRVRQNTEWVVLFLFRQAFFHDCTQFYM